MADWLECVGEYECHPAIRFNTALGAAVAELDNISRPKVSDEWRGGAARLRLTERVSNPEPLNLRT